MSMTSGIVLSNFHYIKNYLTLPLERIAFIQLSVFLFYWIALKLDILGHMIITEEIQIQIAPLREPGEYLSPVFPSNKQRDAKEMTWWHCEKILSEANHVFTKA